MIMNSSMFLKVFECILSPYLERYIPIHSHQFACRRITGCSTAGTVLKEAVLDYAAQGSSVYRATVDLSKAYDRINIDRLIRELRCSVLPDKIVDIFEFMGKIIVVNV